MSHDQTISFRKPEPRDQEVTDAAWIRDLLANALFGTLVTAGECEPVLDVHLFVFDPATTAVYLRRVKHRGAHHHGVSRHQVAFSVTEMGRVDTADGTSSSVYGSVVLEGTSRVVHNVGEATRVLDLLMRKYASHLDTRSDYRAIAAKDLAHTTVYRIDIESWTGKGKTAVTSDASAYQPMVASQHAGW